ncbi:3-hydroxyisobutyrate dehydrogenase [Brevibacterium sanguinis]|uniref:3-hydroxyisobutyrate dehydrogenase n=2 Tax=Brevibacterium TaxID=1696 RepID=A0A366IGS3_9MICO|nr:MULTISPECIES: NAD(P)-dependent oxidoreductase [Brevibacterium]RBP62973.1 3-hydroxyisobutyrate dehydrogenase [Brevibacterium sanguinis]RBP69482.1 3-hydroxyisobutyrate dehydrogenase [Brevibacterium celere]
MGTNQSRMRPATGTVSPGTATPTVGFIGLGLMGSAMAANLARSVPLMVWNRSPSPAEALAQMGAHVAPTAGAVIESCRVVFLMLSDEAAVDAVLPRDGSLDLRGRIIVLMSTVSHEYSRILGAEVERRGGSYVEAPVSGSREPAERGDLIAMAAGDRPVLDEVEPHLRAMCRSVVRCGQVPGALAMKLAVNTFLITVVTGLAEAFHFAEENGLDTGLLREILDAGPMSSVVSRAKSEKLVHGDWTAQAAIPDVRKNCRLIVDQARRSGHASPLMDVCERLFAETEASGHGGDDMAAVITAIRARTHHASPAPGSGKGSLGR